MKTFLFVLIILAAIGALVSVVRGVILVPAGQPPRRGRRAGERKRAGAESDDVAARPVPGDRDRYRDPVPAGGTRPDRLNTGRPMVRLTKIYTRTGDGGETGLVDGSRAPKHHPRLHAIGEVDEANSALGVAIAALEEAEQCATLTRIQNDLFDLGADLATPGEDFAPSDTALRITAGQVARLEREIDAMNASLPPLRSFILPGGSPAAAALHLARAITRRAERAAVAAAAGMALNPHALAYLKPPLRSPVRARPRRGDGGRRRDTVGARRPARLSGERNLTTVRRLFTSSEGFPMLAHARPATDDGLAARSAKPGALGRARRAAVRRGRDAPAPPGCVARQMASGAHHLVLRDVRAARSHARLPPLRRALRLSVQLLLRGGGRAPRARSARHGQPAEQG